MSVKTKIPKGLKTVCRRVIKSEGVKADGKLKKGYRYVKGGNGKTVKTGTTAKTTKPKKKRTTKKR